MDGGHEPLGNAEVFVDHLKKRSRSRDWKTGMRRHIMGSQQAVVAHTENTSFAAMLRLSRITSGSKEYSEMRKSIKERDRTK
jgi:hypothetical protein